MGQAAVAAQAIAAATRGIGADHNENSRKILAPQSRIPAITDLASGARGLEELGKRLTHAAHGFGECRLFVGDDGRIYT